MTTLTTYGRDQRLSNVLALIAAGCLTATGITQSWGGGALRVFAAATLAVAVVRVLTTGTNPFLAPLPSQQTQFLAVCAVMLAGIGSAASRGLTPATMRLWAETGALAVVCWIMYSLLGLVAGHAARAAGQMIRQTRHTSR